MSIVAGIFTPKWTPELIHIQAQIDRHISRNPTDHRHRFTDNHLFFCQVDYQCYGGAAWGEDEASFISVIGHTLLSASITHDLNTLLTAEDWGATLGQAQGTFCAFQYQKGQNQLQVYCDTLSLRPYYVMSYKGAVIFSSCLRIFPQLGIPLDNNFEAITELATLGYTLGDKTQYQQVCVARPGEMMTISLDGMKRHRYFRWADPPICECSLGEGIERLDRGFKQAVGLYLGADRHAVSTLSGGLDSRLIATELKQQGAELECLNFSRDASLDAQLSQQYAGYHQIPFHSIQVTDTQALTIEQRLGIHWKAEDFPYYADVERPRLFWSGNGGSVCVGQIYTNDAIVAACEQGSPELVVDCYLKQQMAYIPHRLVKQGADLQQKLKENLLEALAEYAHLPLLKAFQLFLWENDQHQHITLPFEEVDRYRLDFCLPFYSKAVLEAMFSMKTEWALKHGIYMKWLESYYPQALVTPWQTYPGHIPCPLPTNGQLSNQWQFRTPLSTKFTLIKEGLNTLFGSNRAIYNRYYLGAQCALTALGLYDCTPSLRLVKRMNQHMV